METGVNSGLNVYKLDHSLREKQEEKNLKYIYIYFFSLSLQDLGLFHLGSERAEGRIPLLPPREEEVEGDLGLGPGSK